MKTEPHPPDESPTVVPPRAPRREGGAPTLHDVWIALVRATLLRCPQCGRGALFKGSLSFSMHERCPVCHLKYDRGDGYFIGATALNLVLAETVATLLWLPLAIDQSVPLTYVYLVGIVASIGLPIIGFRHARSFWLAFDRLLTPVS